MRVLFTFVGGRGHADPLLSIARAAQRAGHHVAFACRPSMVATVRAAGFADVTPSGPDVPDPTSVTPLMAPDPAREDRVLSHGLADITARHRAGDVTDLCTHARPDVLVADEVDFGAVLAAEALRIPHATVVVLAAGGFLRTELVAEPLTRVRHDLGLPPDPDLRMLERRLVLAPMPPSFRDPAFPLSTRAVPIRPGALDPVADPDGSAWPARTGDRPRVYVTLGTIFNMESGDLFDRIVDAVAPLRADVVVTVGRHLDPLGLGPVPPHVRVERFVPQAQVLAGADLVVSHGGSGSVIGALAHGVPQIVLPMGADQPHNARRCVALGVGRELDPVGSTGPSIRRAIREVLDDPVPRRAARPFRDEALALPPPDHAVGLLEALAHSAPG